MGVSYSLYQVEMIYCLPDHIEISQHPTLQQSYCLFLNEFTKVFTEGPWRANTF